MKILHLHSRGWGFSFFDLLAVVFVVLVLAYMIVTRLVEHPSRAVAKRTICMNNLRQIGAALSGWAQEQGQKFPMSVSTNEGGSMEYQESGQVFRHFLALSNMLAGPQPLVCLADSSRRPRVTDWTLVTGNSNISYFVNVSAQSSPRAAVEMLTGDRCITGGVLSAGLMLITPKSPVGWAEEIHLGKCNIGLNDGSVQQATSKDLRRKVQDFTNSSIKLAIP